MQIARVKGTVVSTNKSEKLLGLKLMIVRMIDLDTFEEKGAPVVSTDVVGAGVGEIVMIVGGSSSRQTAMTDAKPVDNSIIAIIDSIDIEGLRIFDKHEEESVESPKLRQDAPAKTKQTQAEAEKPALIKTEPAKAEAEKPAPAKTEPAPAEAEKSAPANPDPARAGAEKFAPVKPEPEQAKIKQAQAGQAFEKKIIEKKDESPKGTLKGVGYVPEIKKKD